MPDTGSHKATGRALPSWMSSRDADNKSARKEPVDDKDKRLAKLHATTAPESSTGTNKFSKLMEGVTFVLSGFVNPERSTLRSQALEMGAQYQADWNTSCTLLVCAFSNTPKFRQVEADNGTIVSKEWITECYNQKQLVGIETYLLHAGKPWRRQSNSAGPCQDPKQSSSKNSYTQVDKSQHSKPHTSSSSKQATHKNRKVEFSSSEVKKWAMDDMRTTVSWLNSQEEKPDPSEINKIAAEGILTCLQDAIDSLKEGRGLGKIIEEWNFVPHVVEELNKPDTAGDGSVSPSKKEIYHQAIACKGIYEFELANLEENTMDTKKRPKLEKGGKTKNPASHVMSDESDDTVEMTEDEIREAFDSVSTSSIVK